ncbi:hypothetical protein ACF0H5_001355 [Mactra antiquata]
MSEPPLKKKRTILDFFKGKGSKKDQKKTKGKESMATGAQYVPTGNSEIVGGSSNSKTVETESQNIASTSDSNAKGNTGKSDPIVIADSPEPTVIPESDHSDNEQHDDAMITDQQDNIVSVPEIESKKPSGRKDNSEAWKGLPMKVLNSSIGSKDTLGPLQRVDTNHHVLFKTPFVYDGFKPPQPFAQYKDKWDVYHVRMPCSNFSEYPTTGRDGKPKVRRRWEMIQEALLGDIPGPFELEEKILSYNSRYFGKWSFDVLHKFFIEHLADEERNHFFSHTLKKIATLALQLPHLCTAPIPLLRANKNFKVTLSQQQIACLLANAFFCTFPRRNAKSKNSEYNKFPNINFNSLYMGQPYQKKFEKLKCIIHYFNRIAKKMPCGSVTFHRQYIEHMPKWDEDGTSLKGLHVASEGTIEDDGLGMLQVDFANMYLGGGVLGSGCVQEEIRFLICPEMLISRLITECLNKNECLIMTGCERFSNYDGYASSFEWKETYVDKTPRDSWGRIKCEVVAIDALVIREYKSQFLPGMVKRELSKAYCGFVHLGSTSSSRLSAVCTGNWGCGAFGGDKQLKALIQLMAAAKAGRDLCYFTFDDEAIRDQIYAIHHYLTSNNVLGIGDLLKLIEQYRCNVLKKNKSGLRLYGYIRTVFDGGFDDTDGDSNESLELQRLAADNYDDFNIGSDEILDDIPSKGGNLQKQESLDYKAHTP